MADRLVVSPAEQQALWALDPQGRCSHFVKRVADWQSAWGLWAGRWASFAGQEQREAVCLWPALEYAETCASRNWPGFLAMPIPLALLVDELRPSLANNGRLAAVFPDARGQGALLTPGELESRLREECERY